MNPYVSVLEEHQAHALATGALFQRGAEFWCGLLRGLLSDHTEVRADGFGVTGVQFHLRYQH